MIEFVSLFLGLVFGPAQVEVAVDPAVAAVVFELDGERVGELSGPPWELSIDLGGLAARRLEARALDARGREIGRATRLLNVYRPPAEVGYLLHRNSGGWVTMMSLTWESRGRAEPRRAAVAVGGRTVEFEDPSEIWLPPLDPEELHVIETVVEYSDGVVARDQIGVGGPALGGGRDAQAARVIHSVPLLDGEWVRMLDPTNSEDPGLDLQRIVWVEGVHPPGEIEVRVGSPPPVTSAASGPS